LLNSSFLLSATISIRAENTTDTSNENNKNPYSIVVIKDYFEILGVFLDIGVILLSWETVKDLTELAKVRKLQTKVRFRPWIGPNGGFKLLREDDTKKQYSIAMNNFEVAASNVIGHSLLNYLFWSMVTIVKVKVSFD
jgi:hypothetical protein